jgi:hypothetical protein
MLIREMVRQAFGYYPKASAEWHEDSTFFYNRRSEMGFQKPSDAAKLQGLFGAALYDLIYPKWWGGQTIEQPDQYPIKINSKPFQPGTNSLHEIAKPHWQSYVDPEHVNKCKSTREQTLHAGNYGSHGLVGTPSRITSNKAFNKMKKGHQHLSDHHTQQPTVQRCGPARAAGQPSSLKVPHNQQQLHHSAYPEDANTAIFNQHIANHCFYHHAERIEPSTIPGAAGVPTGGPHVHTEERRETPNPVSFYGREGTLNGGPVVHSAAQSYYGKKGQEIEQTGRQVACRCGYGENCICYDEVEGCDQNVACVCPGFTPSQVKQQEQRPITKAGTNPPYLTDYEIEQFNIKAAEERAAKGKSIDKTKAGRGRSSYYLERKKQLMNNERDNSEVCSKYTHAQEVINNKVKYQTKEAKRIQSANSKNGIGFNVSAMGRPDNIFVPPLAPAGPSSAQQYAYNSIRSNQPQTHAHAYINNAALAAKAAHTSSKPCDRCGKFIDLLSLLQK